jgi:hypothetical protein
MFATCIGYVFGGVGQEVACALDEDGIVEQLVVRAKQHDRLMPLHFDVAMTNDIVRPCRQ